jgi:hypothetical protein
MSSRQISRSRSRSPRPISRSRRPRSSVEGNAEATVDAKAEAKDSEDKVEAKEADVDATVEAKDSEDKVAAKKANVDGFSLNVRNGPGGSVMAVPAAISDTLSDVKDWLWALLESPHVQRRQLMLFKGDKIKNPLSDSRTLAECNICAESTLVLRLRCINCTQILHRKTADAHGHPADTPQCRKCSEILRLPRADSRSVSPE